jgi:hypothetical protein
MESIYFLIVIAGCLLAVGIYITMVCSRDREYIVDIKWIDVEEQERNSRSALDMRHPFVYLDRPSIDVGRNALDVKIPNRIKEEIRQGLIN